MSSDNSFEILHKSQLDALGIPESLFVSLERQLQTRSQPGLAIEVLTEDSIRSDLIEDSLCVIPHLVTWKADDPSTLINALEDETLSYLDKVQLALSFNGSTGVTKQSVDISDDVWRNTCMQNILRQIWRFSTLYRYLDGITYIALPSSGTAFLHSDNPNVGMFPFVYLKQEAGGSIMGTACSVAFPLTVIDQNSSLTIDFCPIWSCGGKEAVRAAKLAALLLGTDEESQYAIMRVKELTANHVKDLHLVRQKLIEDRTYDIMTNEEIPDDNTVAPACNTDDLPIKVYTDSNDPMGLHHSIAGLTDENFILTQSLGDADIIYSFEHIFGGSFQQRLNESVSPERKKHILVNQFPFEGAFVQKDHLAREIQKQWGMPLPPWVIESYDLDVQLPEFIGAAILAIQLKNDNRSIDPLWIIKPARGTQSKGHVITDNLAQIIRLLESGGSRVAQKYIERPLCYDDMKVDCRVYVMMRQATPGKPELYIHNRVFFRIAGQTHFFESPIDFIDKKKVFTAMHLVSPKDTGEENNKLPIDVDTIAKLETDYEHFNWEKNIFPKIKNLVRQLFSGMTFAFPKMSESEISARALYGIDVMFEQSEEVIEPKLTEVTFCPANNAICDGYVRDEELYRSFNNDIFRCLFLGDIGENITRI